LLPKIKSDYDYDTNPSWLSSFNPHAYAIPYLDKNIEKVYPQNILWIFKFLNSLIYFG